MTSARPAIFEHLFVLGRPAGGKSEFIDFMKKLPADERARGFGIGRFEEVDDFPWLWEACVEDDAREGRGEARLVSERTREGYNITKPKFRGSLVDHFNRAIAAKDLAKPAFYADGTLLIEFARGIDDGFRESLDRFRPDILQRGAILYIKVSFEESFRRNSSRYKPGQEESILFHKVPDRDMLGFFRDNDWDTITNGAPDGWLDLAGVRVPFVSMSNEPESSDPGVLRDRYARALGQLMDLRRSTGSVA
ncbi:MAG: hypothetical protein NT151_08560 [Acidobacteria bacterium]|nr:hypothetical protein [Acidobacteriota bacterium]